VIAQLADYAPQAATPFAAARPRRRFPSQRPAAPPTARPGPGRHGPGPRAAIRTPPRTPPRPGPARSSGSQHLANTQREHRATRRNRCRPMLRNEPLPDSLKRVSLARPSGRSEDRTVSYGATFKRLQRPRRSKIIGDRCLSARRIGFTLCDQLGFSMPFRSASPFGKARLLLRKAALSP
jgi:hypothetical protein